MPMTVFDTADIDNLVGSIIQDGERAQKHVIEKMRKSGEEIRKQAIANAPVKDGTLHAAIKVQDAGGGRGVGGRFVRKSVEVFVDPEAPSRPGGMPLIDYAYLMHEGLGPFGDYTYGAKGLNVPWRIRSAQHDGGSGNVGGKFLERAFDTVAQQLTVEIDDTFEAAFS